MRIGIGRRDRKDVDDAAADGKFSFIDGHWAALIAHLDQVFDQGIERSIDLPVLRSR